MRLTAKSVALLIRIFQTALVHRLTTSLVGSRRSAEYQDSHGHPSAVARITLRSIQATIPCVARRAKHANARSISSHKNIRIYRNSTLPYNPNHPGPPQGAFRDRHGTGQGCGGRDGVGAWSWLQGGDPVSSRLRGTTRR
jgi:hypothetical protein